MSGISTPDHGARDTQAGTRDWRLDQKNGDAKRKNKKKVRLSSRTFFGWNTKPLELYRDAGGGSSLGNYKHRNAPSLKFW
ncbi:hypothetical protein [Paludibacterium paludis]|uniref:hypothetical protein n=1 Tax=Paludibacterium paludis TaxID=1225769 RepID=UPI001672457F|nr:hypothetical protein [Paludibacterium paludis]